MTDNPSPPPGRPADLGVAAIPENIRVLATVRELTDAQLAAAAAVSLSTWQRRKHRPDLWSVQELRDIARALSVEPGRLTTTPPLKLAELNEHDEVNNGA